MTRGNLQCLLLSATMLSDLGVTAAAAQGVADLGAEPLGFTATSKLLPAGGQEEDRFGTSVSVFGDTAVIGVPLDDDNGIDSGSARVFERFGEGWTEKAMLQAADAAAFDNFGVAVAIYGDTALVGADLDDTSNGVDAGSVYVFVRQGSAWIQQAKLVASDGAKDDNFGVAVSLFGDTALIGAKYDDGVGGADSGAAYVFQRSGGVWSQQAKLSASDDDAFDLFGCAVSVSGDTAVVGALGDDDNGGKSGSAYVFVRNGSDWSQQYKLLASDGEAGDNLGISVAASEDTALIGASGDDDLAEKAGAAYVFVRSGTVWTEQAKLHSPDPGSYDLFGWSVALSGDMALIGAPREDEGQAPISAMEPQVPTSFRGSAYVFLRSGFVWTFEENLQPKEITTYDEFGHSLSLSGTNAVVGVWLDDPVGLNSGSAYVFGSGSLIMSYSGSCPGSVTVSISNASPNSEVGVVAAANVHGFTKGGAMCNGTVLQIGEPFQLPPLWIKVDGIGNGSGDMTLLSNRCWLEAMVVDTCTTSGAVLVE